MPDALTQYLFSGHAARAATVDISAGLQNMLAHRDYAPDVRHIVGQALAAAPLLASHLKFEGRISLQYQGTGPVSLLVVQIDNHLNMRGMAKAAQDTAGSFSELLAGGRLSVLLEPRAGNTRYEGVVPLDGDSLATALACYYAQSEELPTRLCLAADETHLRGLLVQKMPLADKHNPQTETAYWQRLQALVATLESQELLTATPQTVMHRLFHAEALTTFEPRPVSLVCQCSRASVSRLVLALGQDDAEKLIAEQGRVEVTCEFCGRKQHFSPLQIRQLFAARHTSAQGSMRQ